MAIKEEQYDPGYEDAYGGAYVERGPEEGQAQGQTNGHCTFSSAENTGNNSWMLLNQRGSRDTADIVLPALEVVISLEPTTNCIVTTGKGNLERYTKHTEYTSPLTIFSSSILLISFNQLIIFCVCQI